MFQGMELVLFLADLLAITFASERFFYTLLLAGLQIKRVALNFLDNVFGLHLTLKAPQGILKGFAFLYSNLCQEKYTSKSFPDRDINRILPFFKVFITIPVKIHGFPFPRERGGRKLLRRQPPRGEGHRKWL